MPSWPCLPVSVRERDGDRGEEEGRRGSLAGGAAGCPRGKRRRGRALVAAACAGAAAAPGGAQVGWGEEAHVSRKKVRHFLFSSPLTSVYLKERLKEKEKARGLGEEFGRYKNILMSLELCSI